MALLCVLCLVPLLWFTAASSTASASAPPALDDSLFAPIRGFTLSTSDDVRVRPSAFRAYRVDLARMRAELGSGGTVSVTIPDPAGTPTRFHVVEHSVMEPELQAAHPEIRTYRGADAIGSTIALDVTPMGFHAFVRRPDGVSWLVDPAFNRRAEDTVLSYASGSSDTSHTFVERELDKTVDAVAPAAEDTGFSTPGGIVSKRTYRMAFLTDNTYATYFGSANVFAEKSTMMARVNHVYNDDLAIEFLLIAGTDTKLNLDTVAKMTGTDGPCGANACYTPSQVASCTGSLLTRNVFVLGQLMGADNFDIGHIGLGNSGGGIAGLGVVGDANKARGCTGLPTPDGDLYAIDYVAHEVGHQMGGNHTFNGATGSCSGGNRNGGTSVEPGSGSSVMAYAGICGADNLQAHSDPYFSQRSIDEIEATTAAGPSSSSERQSVAFSGLAVGEQISISCAACPAQTVTWAGTPATDALNLTTAIQAATGSMPTVGGYDGAATVTATGFTANWGGSTNIATLVVAPVVGGQFTALVGTIIQGGPETNGGAVTLSANSSPTVTGAADKTIPARTPFALTPVAVSDPNGDTLTYMWEQNDIGGASGVTLTSDPKTVGPLFRQFGIAAPVTSMGALEYESPGENLAGTNPTRTFPDLVQILAGNTNAATGSCPAAPPAGQTQVDCLSEFLPTSAYLGASSSRQLNFRLSVRDEFTPDAGADDPGGLTQDDVVLTVDPAAGPFLVTSRATPGAATGFETVSWSVAGTSTAALAQNVKISLSTDGGLSYPTVLTASTANDGSETVILPNVTTSTARLKVEAVGNYFFDVNDANFSISPSAGNLTPLVNAGPDATVTLGSPFSSSGTFADEAPGTATATVDYGDGSGPQPLALTGSTFSLSKTYTTVGTKTVTVKVTDASAAVGTDTATVTVTPGTTPPPVPAVTPGTVAIKGKTIVGKRLKAKVAGWSPDGLTYSYEWLRNGKVIKGAKVKTYTLTKKDKGKRIRIRVTGSKPGYTSGVASSNKTGKIQDA